MSQNNNRRSQNNNSQSQINNSQSQINNSQSQIINSQSQNNNSQSQNNNARSQSNDEAWRTDFVNSVNSVLVGLSPEDHNLLSNTMYKIQSDQVTSDRQMINVIYKDINSAWKLGKVKLVASLIKLYPLTRLIRAIITKDSHWVKQEDMNPIFEAFVSKDRTEGQIVRLWENMNNINNERTLLITELDLFINYVKNNFPKIVLPNNFSNNNNSQVYTINNAYNEWDVNANANASFPTTCETLLTDVDPMFYEFSRKVAKICSSIKSYNLPTKTNMKIILKRPKLQIIANPEHPVDSLVYKVYNKTIEDLPLLLEDFDVTYEGQEGIGEGVNRDFITRCIKDLVSELLEPVVKSNNTKNNTKTNLGQYNIKKKLDLTYATKRKLVTFGYLIGIMVLNDIPFEIELKRSLLHMCLFNTKPSEDISYLVYQMVEDPDSKIFIQQLMKNPDHIELSGLDFEDVGRKEKPVTKSNFISFLRIWEEYYHIPPYCKYVAEGMNKKTGISNILLKKGINVYKMYDILCNNKLDKEKVKDFVKEQVFFEKVPTEVQGWFSNILLESDVEFVKNLVYFWSGTYSPMKGIKYQIVIGERVISDKVCPLPESHTCYAQLVLPKNITSKEQLKDILEKAIGYVAKGMLMYGGKATKKKSTKSTKTTKTTKATKATKATKKKTTKPKPTKK
jgi:hypothetical protein